MAIFPSCLIWFSSFKTQDDYLTGLGTITKKALHMLSGQQQVSMQETVHMVDNQKLVICSDMMTYVSLSQGQALRSETDNLHKKTWSLCTETDMKSTTTYHWNSTYTLCLLIQHSKNRKRKTLIHTNTASWCQREWTVSHVILLIMTMQEACSSCTSRGIKIIPWTNSWKTSKTQSTSFSDW